MTDTRIEIFTFEGGKPGPTLLVLGAVHGHEVCGTIASRRLLAELEKGDIKLASGRLIVIPVTNPGAYTAGKRFLERDLNRYFYPKPPAERKFYEDHLDDQIIPSLKISGYILNIHSYTAGGDPFIFIGGHDAKEKDFAEALGVAENYVWGWEEAYADANAPDRESQGITEYARLLGARVVTLECGQHRDPLAADVAYAAIINAMTFLGIANLPAPLPKPPGRRFARMKTVIRNDNLAPARPFRHFDAISAGEILAEGPDRKVRAEADGYIVMPSLKTQPGEEMLYVAVNEEPLKKS